MDGGKGRNQNLMEGCIHYKAKISVMAQKSNSINQIHIKIKNDSRLNVSQFICSQIVL